MLGLFDNRISSQIVVIEVHTTTRAIIIMNRWVVHKFGGTSVGNADCIRKCVNIIRPQIGKSKIAVVVSAMGGKPKVTDMLLDSVHAAANGNMDASGKLLQEIHRKHEVCVGELLKAFLFVVCILSKFDYI